VLRMAKSKILGLCFLGLALAIVACQMKPVAAFSYQKNVRVQVWVKLLRPVDPWPCDGHAEIYCNLQLFIQSARIPGPWPWQWVSVSLNQRGYIGEYTFSGLLAQGNLKVQVLDYDFPSSELLYQDFFSVSQSNQFTRSNSKVEVTVRISLV
jgi:hypothetical protein